LVGYARNLDDGRVEVLAQGPTEAIDAMVRLLSEQPSSLRRPGRVAGVVAQYAQPIAGLVGFKER
ncbi:MAG TPA: acylphosphatase, partial [Dermatophilaceae bacterium]|nr:acylphosphatase [Dermatophilaceae bacterium]HQK61943.1 acylphosphatase [Dermatophilaceae bacterium]